MATQDDKLVARCLREIADLHGEEYSSLAGQMFDTRPCRSDLRKRADALDPPEDRATRIAKRLVDTPVQKAESYFDFCKRLLREEGV
jgi:hypothetical protein